MCPDRDTIAQLLPAHRLQQHVFTLWLFKGKSKYIAKHLMYDPSGNYLVLFSLESWRFPRLRLGKHQDSTVNVYCIMFALCVFVIKWLYGFYFSIIGIKYLLKSVVFKAEMEETDQQNSTCKECCLAVQVRMEWDKTILHEVCINCTICNIHVSWRLYNENISCN